MSSNQFVYSINIGESWPPPNRPKPPFSPSVIEIIRSCALRSCFESSSGYERRIGFAARIGLVMHRVIQSLHENPINSEITRDIPAETRSRFNDELRNQESLSSARPRERLLSRNQNRIGRASDAVVIEAIRIFEQGQDSLVGSLSLDPSYQESSYISEVPENLKTPKVDVEVTVQFNDIFKGRIDRAEIFDNDVILYDYKSALRDDLPERYQRQMQLYAYMWKETRGNWPIKGYVFYPLTAVIHEVQVSSQVCNEVVEETKDILKSFQETESPFQMATPGDICKVCDFRPWCKPFWYWQSDEKNNTEAFNRTVLGFEGYIKDIKLKNYFWHLLINWRNATIRLVVPQESYPHLKAARTGTQIRVLDTKLKGLRNRPQAKITEASEIFIINQ